MKFLFFLSFFPGFLVALSVHEAAHALVSKWLGDGYAQKQGRISLNPMRHLSALGTLMLFVAGFGWGKPVPVNLYNYKHPKFYYLLSSLAGPASNILLCLLSLALIYGVNFVCQTEQGRTELSHACYMVYAIVWFFFYSLLYINVILAIVNLIPVPPLDGSKIWPCLIPKMRPTYSGKTMWLWIVILIVLMRGDTFGKVIDPVIEFVQGFMPAMLFRQESLPSDFPAEMKAPGGAYNIDYSRTLNAGGEPNMLMTTYGLDEPYPAVENRRQLVRILAEKGWFATDNNDPNHWTMSDVKGEGEGKYKILSWSKTWKKENAEFDAYLDYYADPNGQNPEESLAVEYKPELCLSREI